MEMEITQKVNEERQIQREVVKLADKVYNKLQKEKRIYWSSLLQMAKNDEILWNLTLKELKSRNVEVGSSRKPYVEKNNIAFESF